MQILKIIVLLEVIKLVEMPTRVATSRTIEAMERSNMEVTVETITSGVYISILKPIKFAHQLVMKLLCMDYFQTYEI